MILPAFVFASMLLLQQQVGAAEAGEEYLGPFTQRIAPTRKPADPVLAFPEPGLDDTAAYQGYQTRFYRDSKNNTVQIYLQPKTSRVVLVWADAANESAGFSVKNAAGHPIRMEWDDRTASVSDSGATRTIEYSLRAPVSRLDLGWFVLGSMRIERDFVYANRHLKPFGGPPFQVAEESLLVANVARLPPEKRGDHLTLLNAETYAQLASRLTPTIASIPTDTVQTIRIQRPSLDGRNRLLLQFGVDPRRIKARVRGQIVSLETRPGSSIHFTVRVTTDATPLKPLAREEIFNQQFLDFLERSRTTGDTTGGVAYRRLERQVRGVELLSSQEKLMAGLPNFATYFGRDMMMTALMMRPIWSPDMSEHVIASVLRKLGPKGDVSHEEALGGQAIREHAVVYDSLLAEYFRAEGRKGRRADTLLEKSRELLSDLQKTRENYHMIDDEFQLPVLTARYLADSMVPTARKRAFLLEKIGEDSKLNLLLRELDLVASLSLPYVSDPTARNLVSFPRRDATHWRSASWRDSDAGYAGGRFAMDINAIWVPQALEAIDTILKTLPGIGVTLRQEDRAASSRASLNKFAEQPQLLKQAIETWKSARRHFLVTLSPSQIRRAANAKLASLPPDERAHWRSVLGRQKGPRGSLTFLALSLDASGKPIGVVNTDVATGLFLDSGLSPDTAAAELAAVLRLYPVGLFVEGLGPLVANDAYAPPPIWKRFENDQYHGPRVVWGREVNLLFLGLAGQINSGLERTAHFDPPMVAKGMPELAESLQRLLDAVNESGLQHNELWSYEIKGGKLTPVRYGTSSDVQLWNTTNLVVHYVLSQLPKVSPPRKW